MRNAPPSLATLIVLAALSSLSLTIIAPSLASIAEDLTVSYAAASWALGGYLAVTGALMLVLGPLADRYGRRPVILVALTVFVLASFGAAIAEDFGLVIFCRMLQGAVIAGWSVSLAVVRDTNGPTSTTRPIAIITMAMAVAPMLAPLLGGFIESQFGWRAIFLLLGLAGLGALGLCLFDFGETLETPQRSARTQALAYLGLLRTPPFWGYALCMACATGAFYAFISGAPLVTLGAFGLSPEAAGLAIGSITAGFFVGNFVASRLSDTGTRLGTILAGRAVACIGLTVGLALGLMGILTPLTLFGATLCVGLGNGLTMPSASAGAVAVDSSLAGSAAGLAGGLMVGLGAIWSALGGALVTGDREGALMLLAIMLVASFASALAPLVLSRPASLAPAKE